MQNSVHYDEIFSVSQLNRKVKDLLENHFPLLWVEGEISNLNRPASGHWYFTLKDEQAQISCAMFKRRNTLVNFKPKVGDHIKIRARVSLYEGRGDYQLVTEHMEEAGYGILQRRFEELKEKLRSEGLFDPARKRKVPQQLHHIGIITSPSGAAIRDVLSVLERRFPVLPVTIVPTSVQGEAAPREIINAIRRADAQNYSALILCRGGGSLEDLWAFNNEELARAIIACKTPIASAIGHEIDFTIADFVADLRAPTPSAAAEMLSPDQQILRAKLRDIEQQLHMKMRHKLADSGKKLHFLNKRLRHPREKVEQWHQRLDQLEIRLTQTIKNKHRDCTQRFTSLAKQHRLNTPLVNINQNKECVARLKKQMQKAAESHFSSRKKSFEYAVSKLHIISPMATISRGYSIASDADKNIIRSIDDVDVDETFTVRVSDGAISAKVTDKT